jgi:hypothetical protein
MIACKRRHRANTPESPTPLLGLGCRLGLLLLLPVRHPRCGRVGQGVALGVLSDRHRRVAALPPLGPGLLHLRGHLRDLGGVPADSQPSGRTARRQAGRGLGLGATPNAAERGEGGMEAVRAPRQELCVLSQWHRTKDRAVQHVALLHAATAPPPHVTRAQAYRRTHARARARARARTPPRSRESIAQGVCPAIWLLLYLLLEDDGVAKCEIVVQRKATPTTAQPPATPPLGQPDCLPNLQLCSPARSRGAASQLRDREKRVIATRHRPPLLHSRLHQAPP